MKPVIMVENLRKVYRVGSEQVVALDEVSFDIPQGQICCIVGTSGSGKSTLLNQLAGLEKPTRGSVSIGGSIVSRLSEDKLAKFRQRNVGFIFQSYNLMPSMTALENVCMPLIFRGVSKAKREKAARSILRAVGLGNRIRHTPSQMSGGQQQRVGIARAFVAMPKIVFADEPTGNLDSKTTIEVMLMMVGFARKYDQTMIIVTHNPELALYADRIVTLIDGNIVTDVLNQSIADAMLLEQEQEKAQALALEQEQAATTADSTADTPMDIVADTVVDPLEQGDNAEIADKPVDAETGEGGTTDEA